MGAAEAKLLDEVDDYREREEEARLRSEWNRRLRPRRGILRDSRSSHSDDEFQDPGTSHEQLVLQDKRRKKKEERRKLREKGIDPSKRRKKKRQGKRSKGSSSESEEEGNKKVNLSLEPAPDPDSRRSAVQEVAPNVNAVMLSRYLKMISGESTDEDDESLATIAAVARRRAQSADAPGSSTPVVGYDPVRKTYLRDPNAPPSKKTSRIRFSPEVTVRDDTKKKPKMETRELRRKGRKEKIKSKRRKMREKKRKKGSDDDDDDDDDEDYDLTDDERDIARLKEENRYQHVSRREAFENVYRTNSPGARWLGGLTGAQAVAFHRALGGKQSSGWDMGATSDPQLAAQRKLAILRSLSGHNQSTLAAALSRRAALARNAVLQGHGLPPNLTLSPYHPGSRVASCPPYRPSLSNSSAICNVPAHQESCCVDFHYTPPPYFEWNLQAPHLIKQQLMAVPPKMRAAHPLWRAMLLHQLAKRGYKRGKKGRKSSSETTSSSSGSSDKNINERSSKKSNMTSQSKKGPKGKTPSGKDTI